MSREKSAKGGFKGIIRIAGQCEKGWTRIHADMEVEAKYAPQFRHIQKKRRDDQERKWYFTPS